MNRGYSIRRELTPSLRVGFWAVTGWTPGMRLMRSVVRFEGCRVGLPTALLRMLAAILTALTLGVGYLLVFVSPRGEAPARPDRRDSDASSREAGSPRP